MKDGGDLSYTPCEPQAHFALGTACCVALPQRSRSNLRRLAGKRACRLGFARLSAPPSYSSYLSAKTNKMGKIGQFSSMSEATALLYSDFVKIVRDFV